MAEHHFNVFGTRVAIVASEKGWSAYAIGPDGKRRPADFIVPDFIEEERLRQYLADLFHESATPTHSEVTRIR
jgi:hypothetical protein